MSEGSRMKNGKPLGIFAEEAGAYEVSEGLAAQVSAACTRFLESRGIYSCREFYLFGKKVGMFRRQDRPK